MKLHEVIGNDIITLIKNGDLQPHDKIMSENQLVDKYHTSRVTIRRAISYCIDYGYLYSNQGVGTFVCGDENKQLVSMDLLDHFVSNTLNDGKKLTTKVLKLELINTNYDIKKKFKRDIDQVYCYQRLRLVDNRILSMETGYLAKEYCDGIDEYNIEKSITRFVKGLGHEIKSYDKEFRASLSSKEVSNVLDIKEKSPILQLIYVDRLVNDDIFAYIEVSFNQQDFKFGQRVVKG
ncbi:MAG: GntR family transcriptional regulator [Erysipelotrichaceae bacterium]